MITSNTKRVSIALEDIISRASSVKQNEEVETVVDDALSESKAFEKSLRVKEGLKAVPLRFKDANFNSFKERSDASKQNKRLMMNYAKKITSESYKGNLVMLGSVGSGKTHLAISVIRHFLENSIKSDPKIGYTTLYEMLYLNKGFNPESKKSFSDLLSADLLVIDEVNTHISQYSDFDKSALFDIFNHRYNEVKPTIVISNLNDQQIESALGIQVISRLFQDSKNIVIFNDSDFRTTS